MAWRRSAGCRPVCESLSLLEGLPTGPEPGLATGTPTGAAFAVLHAVADAGGTPLSERARALVRDTVAGWDGTHPPAGGGRPSRWRTGGSPATSPIPCTCTWRTSEG
ncbi:hypothetical protein [Streptosporangium roseum]|uniref:hypothetical protein n=1 Tax=Streptosporangium roseum TaxID=2001 RepID=UPI0004CCE023|nr:hypothetical protein [Streptosporangium roseum]